MRPSPMLHSGRYDGRSGSSKCASSVGTPPLIGMDQNSAFPFASCDLKYSVRLSVLQTGYSASVRLFAESSTVLCAPESGLMMNSDPPSRALVYAIQLPSGDQTGHDVKSVLRASFVRFIGVPHVPFGFWRTT